MKQYDFLVVGSGAAGSASAWLLAKAGFTGICLERGDWVNPAEYPTTKVDWERAKSKFANPVMAERQYDSDYPIDDSNSPIAVCNFNAVGGSTILYSGHFPRFLPVDFQLDTIEGIGKDWPISYDDLKPFFELNEQQMAVSGLVGDPYYPDIENLLPPIPIGKVGEKLANAFNRKKWHWWPSYSAIATRARGGRDGCINLGPCNTGCPQGAKASADITYIKRAMEMGLKLKTRAAVSHILVEDGRAVGVNYHDAEGKSHQIFADKVILAAGAIATPRILLNSTGAEYPDGIANSSGQIGRNLMIHPLGYVEGVVDEPLDTDVGPQGCMLYSLEHFRSRDADHKLGYMMHALRGTGPVETALSALGKRKLKFGRQLYDDFFNFYKKQIVISLICEDLPDEQNRVSLDFENRDSFGVPGVKVDYHLQDNTKKMMAHGVRKAREIMTEIGAKKSYAHGPVRNTGWHIMGTARMGIDPENSVVSPTGRCHDVLGLYIVDSSVFVTGSCVNPANTIQAVSLYLTNRIIKDEMNDC